MADGTDLNGRLVSQGYALAYRRYSTKYVPQEDQAKAAQAGIWAGEFVPPWDWRQGKRLIIGAWVKVHISLGLSL